MYKNLISIFCVLSIFSGCSALDLNSSIGQTLSELANLDTSKPDSKLETGYLIVKTKEAVYGFADVEEWYRYYNFPYSVYKVTAKGKGKKIKSVEKREYLTKRSLPPGKYIIKLDKPFFIDAMHGLLLDYDWGHAGKKMIVVIEKGKTTLADFTQ